MPPTVVTYCYALREFFGYHPKIGRYPNLHNHFLAYSDMLLARKANPLIGLAVMLIANILLCWYPLYQLRNYPAADKPDAAVGAFIIAFALTLVTVLLVPLAMLKVWTYCQEVPPPNRRRILAAAILMSLAMLAPLSYWVAFFIRVRPHLGLPD